MIVHRGRAVACVLVALLTASTIVGLRSSGEARLVALVTTGALHGLALHLARRNWVVPPLVTAVALTVLLAAGLWGPPQRSRDVWAYATYGQMVLDGHDPYVERPSEISPNAYTERMAPGWRQARAVYGPVFLGIAALGMTVAAHAPVRAAERPTVARLWFQSMAGLALICALVILWRTGRDPTALVALGLSPVVTIGIVHEAHNDLLVGAALLAGVVLSRRRPLLGAAVASTAVLVKVSALLPLVALLAWVLFRHGWRRAVQGGLCALFVIVAAYGAVGGQRAVRPILAADRLTSSSSIWSLELFDDSSDTTGRSPRSNHPAQLAVAVVAGLVIVARRRDRDGALAVTGTGLAYLLGAAYVLPWYSGWVLPTAASTWRSWTTRLLLLFATLSLITYGTGTTFDSPVLARLHHLLIQRYLPLFEVAAVLLLVAASIRRARRPRSG